LIAKFGLMGSSAIACSFQGETSSVPLLRKLSILNF
jgi:hypothetical protein